MLDTNVVLSGLTSRNRDSPPARVLESALRGSVPCVVSSELLAEYRGVLGRAQHGLSQIEIDELIGELGKVAVHVDISNTVVEGPDPGDAHLWRLLRAHPGAVLITGDRALLSGAPEGLQAISPRAWIDEHLD